MQINIANDLYVDDCLKLKKVNYIFGKNGTGKSTLTKMLKEQCSETYDVRVFQGFESIISTDDQLETVVLGEENTAIQKEIHKIQDENKALEKAMSYMDKDFSADLNREFQQEIDDLMSQIDQLKSDFDRTNPFNETRERWAENHQKYQSQAVQHVMDDIDKNNQQMKTLMSNTKSEQKIAENINKKLSIYVGFELEHYEDSDHKGYYRVKDLRTGASRPVTQLSTGEKSIVAFLYFLEKLKEVDESKQHRPKMIVFDDPMNSNDVSMRHLITNELDQLVWKKKNRDYIVILTHNIDCYLQLCLQIYSNDNYNNNYRVIHLEKNGDYRTSIKIIKSQEEDFATDYELMWRELIHMYEDKNLSADGMVNTMRRIIETYTKFNGLNWNNFCNKAGVPLVLFHAGSHAVTNSESQTNVNSKPELVRLFYQCFEKNGAVKHIRHYWKDIDEILGL